MLHPHGTNEYKDALEHEYHDKLFKGLGGIALHSRFVVVAKKWLLEALHLQGPVRFSDDEQAQANAAHRDEKSADHDCATAKKNLRAMLVRARAHNVKVLVVGRAHVHGDEFDQRVEDRFNAMLRALSKKYGAMARVPKSKAAYLDQVHFNLFGANYAAGKLAPEVRALLR